MEWVDSIFRNLFFELDKIIYGLISSVYSILLQLTRTTLFDQDIIHQFSERIYALVGIFMLFKVSISIINYIINPDDFSDKGKGMGGIIKNVLFSLALIVLVPYIFSEAYDLQAIILKENSIMNLVFGSPADRELDLQGSNSSYAESAGQKIQFTIMYAFAQPNYNEFYGDGKYDLSSCSQTYAIDGNGYYTMRETPVFGNQASRTSSFIYALNDSCWGTYNPDTDEYEGDGALLKAFTDANYSVVYQNYAQGVAQQSFSLFFRKDIILAKDADTDRFLVNYKYGISTAVGVATLYLLLMFCIDIAIRSIKLGFLQMIAPIPIISYCDPKSGKDGMFKKWVTMCGKTYADLFIRLFALYLGIYIISLLGTFKDIVTGEPTDFIVTSGSSWLFHIFLILGVLIFIKKLPDILKDIIGFKGDGKFHFNPIKRIEEDAFLGKNITGAIAGANAGFRGEKGMHKLGGLFRGATYGAVEGKGWAGSTERQADMNRKIRAARANGITGMGILKELSGQKYGVETPSEVFERTAKARQADADFHGANLDYAKGVRAHILDELQNKKRGDLIDDGVWRIQKDRILDAEAALQAAQNSGNAATIRAARENLETIKDSAIDEVITHGQEDKYMISERQKFNVRVRNNPSAARQAGLAPRDTKMTVSELSRIKGNSIEQKNAADMDVYANQKSTRNDQYQAEKSIAEVSKFKF